MELVVQPAGSKGNFRLGVNFSDSRNTFVKRGVSVILLLGENEILVKTTCGPPLNKGFDFNSKEIDKWVKDNNFHKYPPRRPTKLNFRHSFKNEKHILNFLNKI